LSDAPAPGSSSPPTAASSSTMQRDVVSAYAATAAKILSWVIVLGLVYRFIDAADFAMLALVRGTIGILNYTTLGLSPAMIRMLAEAAGSAKHRAAGGDDARDAHGVISYFNPDDPQTRDVRTLYSNGMLIALFSGLIGIAVTIAYAGSFNRLFHMPDRLQSTMPLLVIAMGVGTMLRLMSDAPGALLQARGLIARDNMLIAMAEGLWVLLSLTVMSAADRRLSPLWTVGMYYAASGAALLAARTFAAREIAGILLPQWRSIDGAVIRRLLAFGSLVLFAQLADYLYAPTDYVLINLFLGWEAVAAYTPAMTIDSGLLLLVTGLSSVILPRTAIAHTAGEIERVRRYYLWGTVFSALLLLVAAACVWIASPLIFRLWLGSPMTATQAILPLVLIHTVVGGSSAVGRSILLGMGRVRAFTISVLIAGVSNVVLSYIFVRHLNLGLRGIVLGTIVVVVARAGLWMPWYVMRSLRREGQGAPAEAAPSAGA
jgi:O-antigen/teichoic acid export membrane protein